MHYADVNALKYAMSTYLPEEILAAQYCIRNQDDEITKPLQDGKRRLCLRAA
jgi:hypothetical protein